MAVSAEHEYISQIISDILCRYTETNLLGVKESDRKLYDYGCILERDCSRALTAQVLWSHTEGIEKDIRSLLINNDSLIKLYFVKDTVKNRLKIQEILVAYGNSPITKEYLKGLKIFYLPSDFDADSEFEQALMSNFIENCIRQDLLFATVFGKLDKFTIKVFANHGGPMGLKLAVLDEICQNGMLHTPTFKQNLDYKTNSTLREVTTMLAAVGLVRRIDQSVVLLPSLKGRMMLDLVRRLNFSINKNETFPNEINSIVNMLFPKEHDHDGKLYFDNLLESTMYCKIQFGRDLLDEYNSDSQVFYSEYDWKKFYHEIEHIPGITKEFFNEPNCFFWISE